MKYKLFHIKVKDLVFWSLAIITSAIMSCSNTDSLITDPEVVRQDSINQSILDNQAIDDYIAAKGFAYVFSSSTGIRYVFLKEGNGQTPNLNDIVSIDYVGKNLSDVVFDTSNTQAAIDAEIYTEGRSYSPIRFNLTSNGSG
ncbi:MAG: hypothetical protein NWS46_07420, partial [Cyclobacteriaceae bacterium]|nr:hypothetical protein [Cyclobacteriaceae bacterium]